MPPRIVETERVYTGWNTLDIVTVEAADADGTLRRHKREVIDHGEAAVVLAIDRERGVAILVRQWRAGLLATAPIRICWKPAPASSIRARRRRRRRGARRRRRSGVEVGALRSLGSILPSAGTLTERMHSSSPKSRPGTGATRGGGNPHEGEDIEVVEVPLAELYDMARHGAIEDAKTLVIVQRLMLEERKRA